MDLSHSLPIVPTKFYRPRPAADAVPRPHLLARLHASSDRPFILISAAAGSGKTTLLSSWLDTLEYPSTWLSLDEGDDDLVVFMTYFVTAVQKLFPGVGRNSLDLAHAHHAPPLEHVVRTLTYELAQIGEEFVVVLDDYHHVHERVIHDLLAGLLRHPPPTMHLVVATRSDPPLPLTTLLAQNQMLELRTHDLLFTADEAAAFLQPIASVPIDGQTLAALVDQTEGWATGLRLTALALQQHGDLDRVLSSLQGESRYIHEYLIHEVLANQPPVVRTFLLQIAIFKQFCSSLCDAVVDLGESNRGSRTLIEQLDHDNLFIVSLDDAQQWYRYHHLFRQLLRHELHRHYSPADIAELHTRASAWFAEQGFFEEALTHALAAQNQALAIRLIKQHRHHFLNLEAYNRLRRWLGEFPAQSVETDPDLLVLQAWLDIGTWPVAERLARLHRVEAIIAHQTSDADQFTALRGELDVLRAGEYQRLGDLAQDAFHAQRALITLPSQHYAARILARIYLAGSQLRKGEFDATQRTIRAGFHEEMAQDPPYRMRMLIAACFLHWATADQRSLSQDANQVLQLQQQLDMPESHGWARTVLGHSCYLQNDLAAAEEHYAAVTQQLYRFSKLCVVESMYGLALIHQARGETARANERLESAGTYAIEIGSTAIQPFIPFYQAELELRQGQLVSASRRAEQLDEPAAASGHTVGLCIPSLTHPKILVAQNSVASRRRAAELLVPLYQLATRTHNYRFQIEVLILRALLRAAEDAQNEALSTLEEAVHLAEPTGYVRIFVDHGARVAVLLRQLRARGVAPEFLGPMLAAFPTARPATPAAQRLALADPLTTRELEILELLAQRLSNQEIAQKLVVSTETVKKHASNLYQKLAVHNRRQAVDQAIAMGILPQD